MKLKRILKEVLKDEFPVSVKGKDFIIQAPLDPGASPERTEQILINTFQDIFKPLIVGNVGWEEVDIEKEGKIVASSISIRFHAEVGSPSEIDPKELVYDISEIEKILGIKIKSALGLTNIHKPAIKSAHRHPDLPPEHAGHIDLPRVNSVELILRIE